MFDILNIRLLKAEVDVGKHEDYNLIFIEDIVVIVQPETNVVSM